MHAGGELCAPPAYAKTDARAAPAARGCGSAQACRCMTGMCAWQVMVHRASTHA